MLIHYIMPCDVLGKNLYIIVINKDLEKINLERGKWATGFCGGGAEILQITQYNIILSKLKSSIYYSK